jgi:hypothetical protein
MMDTTSPQKIPRWFWAAAGVGLAWNCFGLVQFIGGLSQTEASLIDSGLTAAQAAVMTGYPAWMTAVFALGVIGDIVHGVFAAMGAPQVIVLTVVVAITAALLWLSLKARSTALLM